MRFVVPGLLLLAALAAPPSRAQDPIPTGVDPPPAPPTPFRFSVLPEQWQRALPPIPALDVPRPVTRDGATQRVTLQEAIALALENNPGIAAQRLEPVRVEQDVLEAQSQFDPAFGADLLYSQSDTPNVSSLAETTTSRVNSRVASLNLGKLFRTSTQFSLLYDWERLDNNARFFTYRPSYVPELGFSLVQPLLRGFGWDFSYLVVRVAERTAEAALYQYEADLADFVRRVINAYYEVMGARANVQVRREAEELALRTVEENKARVRVGLLPPVAILEAQTDAARRRDEVIRAENLLEVTRQRLAQICFYRPEGTFVPRTLEPVEYEGAEPVDPDLERTLATALDRRPEILASSKGVEARQLNERIAGNALLPQVNAVGSYGVNGLSGRGRNFVSDRQLGGCQALGDRTFICPGNRAPFDGGRGSAYDRMVSGDYKSYSAGIQVEVPLDNAAAKARLTRSRVELNQSELNHRELLSQVTFEVRQSIADVLSGRERIAASRVAVELAEENLRTQQKRFEVGLATTKDLLDFQQRLTEAQVQQVQANLDYALSVAAWRRAQGTLLEAYNIVLAHPKHKPAPWFAKF